jgi:large repetitive protein
VTCTLASLAPGANVVFGITARLGAGTAGGELTNRADVRSDTPDPIAANKADVTAVAPVAPASVPAADLVVSKRALGRALLGRRLRYEIAVENRGPSAASGVSVTDALPSRLDFVAASASQGSCSGTSTVTCALGDLAAGARTTITLTVVPRRTGNVTNSATAGSSTPDPSAGNNVAAATVRTRLPRSKVRVSKRADRSAVTAGGVIAYRIAVRNTGGAVVRKLRVCDRLGSGLGFVTRPGSRLRDGQACWTINRLARRKTRTFRVTARTMGVTASRRVTNRVRVTAANVAARTARAGVRVRPAQGPTGGVTG